MSDFLFVGKKVRSRQALPARGGLFCGCGQAHEPHEPHEATRLDRELGRSESWPHVIIRHGGDGGWKDNPGHDPQLTRLRHVSSFLGLPRVEMGNSAGIDWTGLDSSMYSSVTEYLLNNSTQHHPHRVYYQSVRVPCP